MLTRRHAELGRQARSRAPAAPRTEGRSARKRRRSGPRWRRCASRSRTPSRRWPGCGTELGKVENRLADPKIYDGPPERAIRARQGQGALRRRDRRARGELAGAERRARRGRGGAGSGGDAMTTAEDHRRRLGMTRHPEGGWYRRDLSRPRRRDGRAASTAIYYLLEDGDRSHWHRVDAAEVWHFYAGAPLALSLSPDGKLRRDARARGGPGGRRAAADRRAPAPGNRPKRWATGRWSAARWRPASTSPASSWRRRDGRRG